MERTSLAKTCAGVCRKPQPVEDSTAGCVTVSGELLVDVTYKSGTK
jgi:hypothetical protein